MNFDTMFSPYKSQRVPIIAGRGMVCTSHPLAAQAGLDVLKSGGNAVDAAVATAAALTVVEPTSNGIGGDAFALVWKDGQLHGINGSGRAPESISIDAVTSRGHKTMPKFGFEPVTTPGQVGAWAALIGRHGELSLADNLAPAIDYARNGHPVAPVVSKYWKRAWDAYSANCKDDMFKPWFELFAANEDEPNRPPAAGEIWKSVRHALTLEEIARTDGKSFYTGALAHAIADFSNKHNGFISKTDLAGYEPRWVEPISTRYCGFDVWQMPPNGQGIVGLIALNILAGYELDFGSARAYHLAIEAIKLAFSAGKAAITDPDHMTVSVEEFLSPSYAAKLRESIGKRALEPAPILPNSGGTIYLCTADSQGNMVSYIQSNYMGFGSGLVVPGTGISLQNRGADFSLDPAHANALQGGKLTYHTIIPGFLTKDFKPIGPFGVMGGYMQPQGHVQVILNLVHGNLNPQQALDAPRWQWMADKRVEIEHHFPRHIVSELSNMGHQLSTPPDGGGFGRGQIIWQMENGALCGGTESRADGAIASY
ncbi:MAG: gamma-glutamyltransferase family protein [Defluviitaleaceae bacterium]|nr:gamma-glutamyltransferase family protein [Defluviitaleaceae bacterium]